MLKLKNIKKSNGIISADYNPECSGEIGRISINIDSGKEVETTISLMDREFPIYLNHALDILRKIKDEKDIPEEKLVMWYYRNLIAVNSDHDKNMVFFYTQSRLMAIKL